MIGGHSTRRPIEGSLWPFVHYHQNTENPSVCKSGFEVEASTSCGSDLSWERHSPEWRLANRQSGDWRSQEKPKLHGRNPGHLVPASKKSPGSEPNCVKIGDG
jgi:hypothetical protein